MNKYFSGLIAIFLLCVGHVSSAADCCELADYQWSVMVNGKVWREVDVIKGRSAAEAVFRIDRAAGTIHFGDGRNGAVPPGGAEIVVEYSMDGVRSGTQRVIWRAKGPGNELALCIMRTPRGIDVSVCDKPKSPLTGRR